MAKSSLTYDNIQSFLDSKTTWSLCIGAGTNIPLLPDWYQLAENMINKYCSEEDRIPIEDLKNSGFSADAIIQAVRNHIGGTDEAFAEKLSNEVYAPIKNKLTLEEWEVFASVHNSTSSSFSKKHASIFEHIIEKTFKDTTANRLAPVVAQALLFNNCPRTILTFNGEAIFLTLIRYYLAQHTDKYTSKARFDQVINGITNVHKDRIPYIHCHGILPITGQKVHIGKKAGEKLVFTEDKYLQLANSPMSWQALQFIDACMYSRIVFIGVSLTDPNMRRWLSWIHTNKMEELENNGLKDDNRTPTEHYWIRTRPSTDVEKIWIEESVAHLGVRLVWINNYNQVGDVLKKMLGLKESPANRKPRAPAKKVATSQRKANNRIKSKKHQSPGYTKKKERTYSKSHTSTRTWHSDH